MTNVVKKNGNRSSLSPIQKWMDRFWDADHLFGRDWFTDDFFSRKNWLPAVNIKENEKDFEIEVAAPGMDKKDFEVFIQNGILFIKAEKEESMETKEGSYTRKEFSSNQFERSFTLPENVDDQNIEAQYEKGVLMITLKKTDVKKPTPKKIAIK